MESAEQELIAALAGFGLRLNADQLAQLRRYAEELERWNAHTNLTAVHGVEAIYRRHFLDSLSLYPYLGDQPDPLIDIGTGAGFPGLPLKIALPDLRVTLADSVGKKTAFLRHMITTLGLAHVRILTERAEELGRRLSEREQYGVVTARALADLRVLFEYSLPLLRVGGRLLAPKGAEISAELAAASNAADMLGASEPQSLVLELPGLESRTLVVVTKDRPTDMRYPRPVGVPTRRPL